MYNFSILGLWPRIAVEISSDVSASMTATDDLFNLNYY